MKILAIDSSGLVASVAVAEDQTLLGEYTMNYKKTHSQTLLPMIEELTEMIDLDLETIDAIAVAGGPGSFTGLRIGAATAKGLGLALDKPLIHISTVDGLAYNYTCTDRLVCPLMDARRNQTYTGLYRLEGSRLVTLVPQCAVPVEEIIATVNETGQPVIFLGDGVPVFQEILDREVKVPYEYAPLHMSRQRAGAVAALAMQYYAEGKTLHARDFVPDYLRLSQAERERMEREKAKEQD